MGYGKRKMTDMDKYKILRASVEDENMLCDMFLKHISSHAEYISHGEIQMGVGEGHFEEGVLVASLAADAREAWMRYIHADLTSPSDAAVYKAVDSSGEIAGFCVAEIQEDGAAPFGMVCDVLVDENVRGSGVGTALLEEALGWFKEMRVKDVYLESGLNNHSAHEYFRRRGFVKVSEIYKLM